MKWWQVPRLWDGETCAILATGPSLTPEDAAYAGSRVKTIAISDAWRLWPKAEILYSCDAKWWNYHQGVPEYAGLRVKLGEQPAAGAPLRLQWDGEEGLSLDPSFLRTGKNSGYQAINLAVLLGCRRIVLLGYDMGAKGGRTHYFGDHPQALRNQSPYALFIERFKTLAEPLERVGVEVINCTPDSALPWFRLADLREVLCAAPSA